MLDNPDDMVSGCSKDLATEMVTEMIFLFSMDKETLPRK